MKKVLALLVVMVSVATSGCGFLSQPADGTVAAPTDQSPSPPAPTETNADTPKQQFDPENRLIIEKLYEGPVTVELYESRVQYNRSLENGSSGIDPDSITYPANRTGNIRVRDYVPDGYAVLYVKDAVAWEGVVSPYYHIELQIRSDGTVDVVDAIAL